MKNELSHRLNKEAYGYLVRSRYLNNAECETASMFHANTEMRNSAKNSLTKLKVEGIVEEDPDLIESEVLTFFNALFNGYHNTNLINTGSSFVPDYTNVGIFLESLEALSDHDRDELEHGMNIDELEYVIK